MTPRTGEGPVSLAQRPLPVYGTWMAARLRTAADLIETHGLAHGDYEDAAGRFCVLGAIRYAILGRRPAERWKADFLYQDNDFKATFRTLQVWLFARRGAYNAAKWNDESTAEQVCAALRECADELDARAAG